MNAPAFRAVDQHTGEVASGVDQSMLLSFAEIDRLQTDLAKARADADELTDLLKASGTHVANLSTGIAQYQIQRDEYREQAEEYRDRFDLACQQRDEALTRVQELEALVDEFRHRDEAATTSIGLLINERDAARADRDTYRAAVTR